MGTIELSPLDMAALCLLACVPVACFAYIGLGMIRDTLISLVRMTVQLVLVGLYLRYLFRINSLALNGLWILVMLAVANATLLHRAGLSRRVAIPIFGGMALATAVVVGIFIALIRPEPLHDARYVIPITGMVLGNCMRGNVLALERFYSAIRTEERRYSGYLLMGASHAEAVRPFVVPALRAAISPTIASMATIGLVSLPGMMTGQMLGGSLPMTAIKYQVAIMICIFVASAMANILNIRLSMVRGFDDYHQLRNDLFR